MNEEIKHKILTFARILFEKRFEIYIIYSTNERKKKNLIFKEYNKQTRVEYFSELKDEILNGGREIKYLLFKKGINFKGDVLELTIADLDKEIMVNKAIKLIFK